MENLGIQEMGFSVEEEFKVEKEILNGKSERYSESGLYSKLQELYPECYDVFLDQLIKVVRCEKKEKNLLLISDILLEFACKKDNTEITEKIVEATIDDIFPILNKWGKPETIKELISEEYSTVLENLETIRKNSDEQTASKCLFGQAILTFPGSEIINGELDS